jgi:uncharacterized lipoprotein YmbA
MKSRIWVLRLALVAISGTLLTGCLLKRATDSTRHFVLSPISTNEPAPVATEHLSVGIGFVKMPSYLLRNSMAIRNGANEIEYLEDARWAERLDQCFQRTLAVNLSGLLPSDSIYLTDFGRDKEMVSVFINVQQFDVDAGGRGTLTAQWRIASPNSDRPLRSGHTRLVRTGATPRRNPDVIAMTLSDLAGEFSRELAQLIRESARTSAPESGR